MVSLRRWSCCVSDGISKGSLITLSLFKIVHWTQKHSTVNNCMIAFTPLLVSCYDSALTIEGMLFCNRTMLRRHTLLLMLSSKQKSRSCLPLELNFFLIQHMLALILRRHPTTVTCSVHGSLPSPSREDLRLFRSDLRKRVSSKIDCLQTWWIACLWNWTIRIKQTNPIKTDGIYF